MHGGGGGDFSGYSWISGFRCLSESIKNGVEIHFEHDFTFQDSHFNISPTLEFSMSSLFSLSLSVTVVLTCTFWLTGGTAVPPYHSAGLLPSGRLLQPRPDGLQWPQAMRPGQPSLPGGCSTHHFAAGLESRHSCFSQVDGTPGFFFFFFFGGGGCHPSVLCLCVCVYLYFLVVVFF